MVSLGQEPSCPGNRDWGLCFWGTDKCIYSRTGHTGQCDQSMEVRPVTIQGRFKSGTCRCHFPETQTFVAPLAYILPCWKRSISLFHDQTTQFREKNHKKTVFREHLHHFCTPPQSGAGGQQPALNRLGDGTGQPSQPEPFWGSMISPCIYFASCPSFCPQQMAAPAFKKRWKCPGTRISPHCSSLSCLLKLKKTIFCNNLW